MIAVSWLKYHAGHNLVITRPWIPAGETAYKLICKDCAVILIEYDEKSGGKENE